MALHSFSGPTVIGLQPSYKDPLPFLRNHSDPSVLLARRSVSARLEVPTNSSFASHPKALVENTSPSTSSFSSMSLSEDHAGRRRDLGIPLQLHRRIMDHESGRLSTECSQYVSPDREHNKSDNRQIASREASRHEPEKVQAGVSGLSRSQKPRHERVNTQPATIAKAKPTTEKHNPFRRWMSTLRRAGEKEPSMLRQREQRWALDESAECLPPKNPPTSHQKLQRRTRSSSGTSSAFVTGVKSASISLATTSASRTSRANFRRTLRSSDQSSQKARSFVSGFHSIVTNLVDGRSPATPLVDQASFNRAVKRRNTLEELVQTEESYIADLKVLVNVYFTLLAAASSLSHRNMTQISNNITEILSLHEELVSKLHSILQVLGNFGQTETRKTAARPIGHVRWHSVDSPTVSHGHAVAKVIRRSLDVARPKITRISVAGSEPKLVSQVARVFEEMLSRFFVYEEYGARYESMLKEMAETSKAIPHWQAYERGIEALANTLAPTSGSCGTNKKGLTFADLLIKPIQRVCRYPLLFSDLLKHTPVIDCPESHAEVEKLLYRLRETATTINRATNDPDVRDRIKRSWCLQDMLKFSPMTSTLFTVRSLGYPTLCGVLHIAYQTKLDTSGSYMLCALYKPCLLLAVPCETIRGYRIVASISLADLRIDKPDNGRGLQCHTALYSWKIIFEADQSLYELILSACSEQEELAWTTQLKELSALESKDHDEDFPIPPTKYSILFIDARSLGPVFGQPGTLARRLSIQRAATVGSSTNIRQVIIRNTHALRDGAELVGPASPNVGRSKSLLTTNRTPILAPRRLDRVRMEHDLSKVWTKDLLPFPGMGGTRGEHIIRASASSVMRKLSKASVASGFTKRSASFTSAATSRFHDAQDSLRMYGKGGSTPDSGSSRKCSAKDLQIKLNEGRYPRIDPPQRPSSGNARIRTTRTVSDSPTVLTKKEKRPSEVDGRLGVPRQERLLRGRWSAPFSLFRALSTDARKSMFMQQTVREVA